MSVADFAARIAEGYQTGCGDTYTTRSFPPPAIRGAAAVFSGCLGCGSADGRSEQMAFVGVAGTSELYTVQWAARGPTQGKPMHLDIAVWKPRTDALAITRICDPVPGGPAPYPSCPQ